MKVSIGADHAGFELKEKIRKLLGDQGIEVVDEGTHSVDSVDYPDYARKVAEAVARSEAQRGILVCGSGIGMAMAANKVHGVRAAHVTSEHEARLSREHNDANVLTLGARFLDDATAQRIVQAFLCARFDGGRHQRRVEKITAIEREEAGKAS
ncbi:MAG: ribose 5-phosphate isomerase B [Terriglobales bacterium]